MDWLSLIEKGLWFGTAATGFSILFNVPIRTLLYVFMIGAFGGMMKTLLLMFDLNVILASLGGATFVGYLSNFGAHTKHAPPLVFAIPCVIPMVPGVFAYKMMLGIIQLTSATGDHHAEVLSYTINNGLNAVFILLSLALGVAIPLLVSRKDSVKKKVS